MGDKKFFFLVFFLLISCSKQKDEEGYITITTRPLGSNRDTPMRWNKSHLQDGIRFKISSEISADFSGEDFNLQNLNPIEQVAQQWNQASPNYTFFALPMEESANNGYDNLEDYFDDEMGIYRSYQWFEGPSPSAVAITQFFALEVTNEKSEKSLQLIHADILLNYKSFKFSTNSLSRRDFYLPAIIIHEMGHFVGLPHSYIPSHQTVMTPYALRTDNFNTLFDADILALNKNYPTFDPSTKSLATKSFESGKIIRGIIELTDGGECIHKIEGREVFRHQLTETKE